MADFTGDDLTGARFTRVDLTEHHRPFAERDLDALLADADAEAT